MSEKSWKRKKRVAQFLWGMLKNSFIIQKDLSTEFVLLRSAALPLSLGGPGNYTGNFIRIVKAAICAELKSPRGLILERIWIYMYQKNCALYDSNIPSNPGKSPWSREEPIK